MPFNPLSERQWWFIWIAVSAAFISVSLITLERYPIVDQDEVQVMELGRSVLEPGTDWGMNWIVQKQMPVLSWSYPASSIQELVYRLGAPASLLNRLFSLLGAVVAAGVAGLWLRARGTPALPALILASIFLLDPFLNGSIRVGRVDSWAIAALLLACYWLRKPGAGHYRLFFVGMVAAAAPFFWPTAAMLLPLIVLEFCSYLLRNRSLRDLDVSEVIRTTGWIIAGGLLTFVVFSLPLLIRWDELQDSFQSMVDVQAYAAVIKYPFIGMYAAHNPLLLPVVMMAFLIRRDWLLLTATAVTLVLMYQTMVYSKRVLYLLPYFIAVMAMAWSWLDAHPRAQRRRLLLAAGACTLLFANLWLSVVRPTIIGLHQADSLDGRIPATELSRWVPAGPHRVLLEEFDLYFAARELGWKIYKPGAPVAFDSAEYLSFLDSMDYVIRRQKGSYKISASTLERAGFREIGMVNFPRSPELRQSWGPLHVFAPQTGYESVLVYAHSRVLGIK